MDRYERLFSEYSSRTNRGVSAAVLASLSSQSCSRASSWADLEFGFVVAPSATRFDET
jgi:hypothetical protein